jgi:Protein of unknown function (DUF4019)
MKLLALTIATAALLSASTFAQDSPSTTQAEAAALAWLALVDAGNYSESWKQAADTFKSAVSEQSWEAKVGKARVPLGALKSRQIQSSTFKHSLPRAADGDYVVIEYATRFENKDSAIETVTPMREKNGSWHVSGYFVR